MILYTSRFGTDLMDSTWGTYKTHHFLSGAKINFENLKKVLDKQNWLWYYIKADFGEHFGDTAGTKSDCERKKKRRSHNDFSK